MKSLALVALLGVVACKDRDAMRVNHATEAQLQLHAIGKKLQLALVEKSTYPIGTSKTLPPAPPDQTAKGCCGGKSDGTQVDHKCPVSNEWATDPVWSVLDFRIDAPSSYRYSYSSSDGKTFTVTATGDLDCDGEAAVFTMTGTSQAGNPLINVVDPPPNTY